MSQNPSAARRPQRWRAFGYAAVTLVLSAQLATACDSKASSSAPALSEAEQAALQAGAKGVGLGKNNAPLAPPVHSGEITGYDTGDADVTIERCRQTGWSYSGCAAQYPIQGRKHVAYECANQTKASEKTIMCRRLAEYYLRGVGGRVDRNRGLSSLTRQCQGGGHIACYVLAQHVRDDDLGKAHEFAELGCNRGKKSPVGCRAFVAGLRAQRDFDLTVTTAKGSPAFEKGSRCRLWVARGKKLCEIRLWCGPTVLYGERRSSFPCDDQLRGRDARTSRDDSDGGIELDVAAKTLRFWDVDGRHGSVELEATLSQR